MSDRQLAIVTGASSGIGEAFARALAARGWDLVLVARRAERLASLGEELRAAHQVDVREVRADLSLPSGVDHAVTEIDAVGRPIDLLINNAGVGSYGAFVELDASRELAMIDLNVRALVALTAHVLPRMVERRAGAVIQIASTTSFQPVPYMATYGATKAFVLSHAEAVAREVEGSGVRVLAVCPGHTPTEFQEISGVNRRPTRTSSQSAQDVAREALEVLEQGKEHMVVTGLPNRVTTRVPRVLPRKWMSWVVARAFRPR